MNDRYQMALEEDPLSGFRFFEILTRSMIRRMAINSISATERVNTSSQSTGT